MPIHGMANVKKAIAKKKKAMNDKVYAAYAYGLGQVIISTPVHFKDGGRLKNGWLLSVNSPKTGAKLAKSSSGSGSFTELATMPKWVIGKKIYFSNNLPWAPLVEYGGYPNPVIMGTWTGKSYQKLSVSGYSRQAPAGMARISIKKIQKRIRA